MAADVLHKEQVESEWEAAPAVGIVVALQIVLAVVSRSRNWLTWQFHWWIWLIAVPQELALLVLLSWHRPRQRLEEIGMRRTVSLMLLALVAAANALLVVAVISSLLQGQEKSGSELLLKGASVWSTNVVAFGIAYWALDRGGPVRRLRRNPPLPDFQFPQMENPQLAPRDWQPALVDYLYVSFTNSIAFSPTDAMPLTRRAKRLMLAESSLSALIVLLVTARAVNIFK
jgi:uncharacterized membrane protein